MIFGLIFGLVLIMVVFATSLIAGRIGDAERTIAARERRSDFLNRG